MDEFQDTNEPPRQLIALTDLLAEAGGDEDWLADPEAPQDTDRHGARRRHARRQRHASRRRQLLPVGLTVLALIAAAVVILTQLRGGTKAFADPSEAAAAAELAGSFAFATRSELSALGRPISVSTTDGQVVGLKSNGAFKVRVTTPSGVGFERIVFPDAVYVRVVGARGEHAWVGSHLKPTVSISTRAGSGGGLGDPLSLLRELAHSRQARTVGTEIIDGRDTRHYALQLPLGALLPRGLVASASLRSISVHIDIWQASDQQLVRALRTFDIGGSSDLRLTIQTDFRAYGRDGVIKAPPRVPLAGHQRLNPTAEDPLGERVLGVLAAGRGHSATPRQQHER